MRSLETGDHQVKRTEAFQHDYFFQESHIKHFMFWLPYTCKPQSSHFSVNVWNCEFCVTKSPTKPPNTKTWPCMYLQEEPSTSPSDEPSGDTDEATDPDEFAQVNAHHTYRSQCNHEFSGLNVVAYLERDLRTTLQDKWKCSRH